jgi:hypothetical protein
MAENLELSSQKPCGIDRQVEKKRSFCVSPRTVIKTGPCKIGRIAFVAENIELSSHLGVGRIGDQGLASRSDFLMAENLELSSQKPCGIDSVRIKRTRDRQVEKKRSFCVSPRTVIKTSPCKIGRIAFVAENLELSSHLGVCRIGDRGLASR